MSGAATASDSAAIAFVRARIAEDRTVAEAARSRPEWRWFAVPDHKAGDDETVGLLVEATSEGMAHWSVDRNILHSCQGQPDPDDVPWLHHAARRNPFVTFQERDQLEMLVGECERVLTSDLGDERGTDFARMILRRIAALWWFRADGTTHPDWRREWATA